MKKKFILLAMMLLTLIGGVKFNVLNAQDLTVAVHGNATSESAVFPIPTYYGQAFAQTLYYAEDLENIGPSTITSVAFKKDTDTQVRDFSIYMLNTDAESLSEWVDFSETDDKVYSNTSLTTSSVDGWMTLTLDTPFEYTGGNIIVITWDKTKKTSYAKGCKYVDIETKTVALYNTNSTLTYDNYKSYTSTKSTRQPAIRFTYEFSVPAVMPSSVPEITSIEATHNSVTLSWNAVENAKKYNVYTSTGDLVNTVSATSCTIEGLDDLTEYCYQVSAVNGEFETEKSTASCATTLEAPKERTLVFELKDSYGDGWNNNYLRVYFNDEEITSYTINSGSSANYELIVPQGTKVKIVYDGSGQYQSENTFTIYYKDGTLINGQEKISGQGTTTYTVAEFVYGPLLLVEASAYNIFSDQTATLTATAIEFNGDVAYSWSLNGEIVGTDATYTFTPTSIGSFEFTCTVTDANDNEASASVTINVTERPALALDVTADKTEIYQGQNTMLNAVASGGFPEYSFNWFLNGEEHGTGSSFYFDQTEVGEYTITCKVTDANGGTIEKSVTVSVLANPFAGKQFRVKVMEGSYAGQYLNVNSHDIVTYPSYWSQDASTRVGVSQYQESNSQKFTIEMYDSQRFYLRDADGYLIKCDDQTNNYGRNTWDVDAYSTTVGTPLWFDYVGEEQFYIRDYDKYLGNGSTANHSTTHNYFKVQDGLVYCDAHIGLNDGENHRVVLWSLEEVLPAVENLVANPTKLYPGETTTLTWDAFEGAASYNIYVNSELKANTTEISYELSDLTYNVEPGHTIEVIAVDENGTEISGKASVTVQVAGTFTLTVNVTDGTNPIEGATVNIDMTYAYDEFKNQISPVTVEPTGADGKTTVELPILCNENGFYNNNGYWVTSYYTVAVSKSPYQSSLYNYINGSENVTGSYTMDVVLLLPMVDYIQVQDPAGNYLHGDVMEGTNVVLSWDAVEGADSYKVYTFVNGEVKETETTIDPKCYIENVVKGYEYAVSALFGDLESVKTTANIDVKGNGYFKGYVTDGTNALQGIQVKVSSEYGDVSAVATTNEEGYFIGEIMEGDNYILTISHSDYDEFISTPFPIVYQTDYNFETIELNAKPSSDVTSVTATVNGDNVDVEWTVEEATKYNVYRRLASAQDCGEMIAEEIEGTTYTDTQWTTVAPGTYQYGVAALVEPQAQTRGTEVIFEEGFENGKPEGWNVSGDDLNWIQDGANQPNSLGVNSIYNKGSWSGESSYLISPQITIKNAKLSFWHFNQQYDNSGQYTSVLKVYYSTNPDGPWIDENKLYESQYTSSWTNSGEIDLSSLPNKVYLAFCHEYNWGNGLYLDDLVITGEVTSETETQIVWSNDVVKQGPATFIGGDTENPTAWNVDANWSTGSVPADGAEVTINANAVISSEVNVASITINNGDSYPYNTLTVADKGILTVTGTISQQSEYLLVLEEGGQIFQNNNNVTARFRMSIDNPSDWSDETNKDGWQFISMPLENVPHTDFTSYGEYDLYKYDGSQDLEWQNHKDGGFEEEAFKSGVGYLASLKDAETATVFGTLNTATPFVFSGYNQIIYNEEKDLANFRLFGNPFTYDIYMSDFDLDFYNDGENDFVSGYAVVNNSGSYDYRTIEPIKVGEGFFVKALSSTAIAYAPASKHSENKSNNSLNITATGNAGEDNVIINLAGKSEGFNKLQNFNDAIATVYVAEDGKNYGIYNCDADVQEIELSFNANQMGNYTISIEPNGKFQTVTLVDRFTGIETNMLVEDYHFTAMSGVNNNRFIIKMVNGQQTTDNSHFVYQSGEDLIIDAEGTVQIIDVMGRVLVSDEVESTNNRINVSGFRNGTYMVRVINGSEVKVEKVVIY